MGGRTWVAIALGKKPDKALAEWLPKLEGATTLPGQVRVTAEGKEKITAVLYVLDITRSRARELAKQSKHEAFYWGTVGEAAERHPVEPFEVDWGTGETSLHHQALGGVGDAWQAILDLIHNPKGQACQPNDMKRTGWLLGAWGVLVAAAYAIAPLAFSENADHEDSRQVLLWVLHPAWGVSIVLGLYLRKILDGLGKQSDQRDLTATESEAAWRRIAPTHAAVWLAAIVAITLLTIARGQLTPGWSAVEMVELWSEQLVLSLWALPAFAYAQTTGQCVKRLLSTGVWLFLALLGMRFALEFASWTSNWTWGIIEKAIPASAPDIIELTWNLVFALAAELSFAGYMLGYTWVHERKHFVLWSSDELTDE